MQKRLDQLKAFLIESPNDSFLKYALTMEYLKLGNREEARLGFEDLLKNDPDYIGTYYHFGKFLEGDGLKGEAIEIFELGILKAQEKRNFHALGELKNALLSANGLLDEDE